MELSLNIYACKLKDRDLRLKSQSGGAFTALATYFLNNSGVVYGCGMSNQNNVIYKRVDKIENLEDLKGSKYVQAEMGNIINNIKKDLDLNKLVLFSGTPCYVHAINLYFKNHINKNKLFSVDIICHGVPSPKIYRDYLTYCENNKQRKIIKFIFRDKYFDGWHKHVEKIIFQNGEEVVSDDYTQLFYTNLTLRPSCGECHYSSMKRYSDFTIGDYWGVEKFYPELDDNTGVSLLFINKERAVPIFEDIKNELEIVKITSMEACQQRNLENPTIIPKIRNWFWKDYKKWGLSYCFKHWSPKGGMKFKIKRKIIRLFKMWD